MSATGRTSRDDDKPILVVATGNTHKLREFSAFLPEFTLRSLAEFADLPEINETATHFAGNAQMKAETIAKHLNLPTLADDSGLVVPVLNGDPGVHSARYAPGSDADRNQKLLQALATITAREAYFACVLAFAAPGKTTQLVEGRVHGRIGYEPRGEAGFGYDPLFIGADGRSFAELSRDEKARVSHRAHAMSKMRPIILSYFSLV